MDEVEDGNLGNEPNGHHNILLHGMTSALHSHAYMDSVGYVEMDRMPTSLTHDSSNPNQNITVSKEHKTFLTKGT